MKYKLMAVDLDGTLLNDKKWITDYNKNRIKEAVKNGMKFVMTSGRISPSLKVYHEDIAARQPLICCNGAYILDCSGNIIYSSSMDKNSALKIIDIIRENEDTYYHFYDENTMYSEQFLMSTKWCYEFNRKLDRRLRLGINIVPDSKYFIENSEKGIYKIVVVDKNVEYLKNLGEKIKKIENIEVTSSQKTNIEIMNRGISKGRGLKILSRYYDISMEECIAVGNGENDISMIDAAGLGVAVFNAEESVKYHANYITSRDNNDGAIGEVIDEFIFN